MPIRHNNRGTLVIERTFGATKVRRASGTNDPRTFQDVVKTLDSLVVAGRIDLVQAVADGAIRPLELHEKARSGSLPVIAGTGPNVAPTTTLLTQAVADFLATKTAGELYMKDLRSNIDRIVDRAFEDFGPRPKLSCLPSVLASLRTEYQAAGHRSSFNTLRGAALALARGSRKQPSALWEQVLSVDRFKIDDDDRREHRPFTVVEAKSIRDLLNEKKNHAGEMFWALCITGMRPKEYFDKAWSLHPHREPYYIDIRGTKTKSAKRKIPLIEASMVKPSMAYTTFSRLFRKIVAPFERTAKGELRWTLYDARRSYAVWSEAAGIPRSRRRYYMGHSKEDITAHYEQTKMEDIFMEDAVALRRYIPAAYSAWARRADAPPTHTLTAIEFEDLSIK